MALREALVCGERAHGGRGYKDGGKPAGALGAELHGEVHEGGRWLEGRGDQFVARDVLRRGGFVRSIVLIIFAADNISKS